MAQDDDKKLEAEDGAVERSDEHREPIQSDDREDEGRGPPQEEADDEGGEYEEEVEAKPARPARFETLSNAAREATERAAAAERRAQELEQRLSRLEKPVAQEREPTAEERALWSTEEHINYSLSKAQKSFETRLNQMQAQMADAQDKAGWDGYCNTDSRAKQLAAEVEQRVLAARQQGVYLSRGQMYTYLVGEKALQRGTKAADTQRQQGQRRIAQQRTSGASPKGDEPRRGNAQLSDSEQRNARLKERGFFDA